MKWVFRTLLVVSVSGMLLFYVWGKVDLVRVGYELDALLKKKADLTKEHERLQARLSQLTAPERIASEAGDKLGMKPPGARQVVLVPSHPGDAGDASTGDGPELPFRLARQTGE